MSKSNKRTFNMFAAETDNPSEAIVQFKGKNKTVDISVKNRLGFTDAMSFVNVIAKLCTGMGEDSYNPGMFDFAVRIATFVFYAGFDIPKSDDKSLKNAYEVMYGTDLFRKIMSEVNTEQFDIMIAAAKEKVHFTRDCLTSSMASKLYELVAKMDEVMNEGAQITQQLSSGEAVDQLRELLSMAEINNHPESVDTKTGHNADDEVKVVRKIIPFPSGEDKA